MTIKKIDLVSTLDVGVALYNVTSETSFHVDTYLLGLGLWDRTTSSHSLGVKESVKGKVIRIDGANDLMSESAELSNMIYQVLPLEDGRIFVGCRNGDLMYLNKDLSLNKKIDLPNKGLYFFVKEGNTLIAAMREGGVLFYDLVTEESKILPVVDPSIRMWSIYKDKDRILASSYRGHLAEIVEGEIVNLKRLDGSRTTIWTLGKFRNQYIAGTANGELLELNERTLDPMNRIFECDTGITYMVNINESQIAVANIHGDVHILGKYPSVISYIHDIEEKIANTVWGMDYDNKHGLLRVAYSNGQLRTFALKEN